MATTFEALQARLIADLDMAHKFVHGLDTESIVTENATIPTLANMAKSMPFSDKVTIATNQAIAATLAANRSATSEQNAFNYKEAATAGASAALLNAQAAAEHVATVTQLKNETAANATMSSNYAAALSATSVSSVVVGLGNKAFEIAAGKQFQTGQWVIASSGAASVAGPVVSYVGTTLTVDVERIVGTGTFTTWAISLSGMPGEKVAPNAYLDRGSVGTGTVTFNQNSAQHQRLQVTGPLTLAVSGWPAAGVSLGIIVLELVNAAAAVITWPTIRWVLADGTYTTTFSANTVTLQAAGTDFVTLWSRDGGATVYGKVVR